MQIPVENQDDNDNQTRGGQSARARGRGNRPRPPARCWIQHYGKTALPWFSEKGTAALLTLPRAFSPRASCRFHFKHRCGLKLHL
jgi:hypothetical protein